MDDCYADLARDYEWLFPDEAVGGSGTAGATSPGSAGNPFYAVAAAMR